jgi:DNA-binding XRE family transcriptional regulator
VRFSRSKARWCSKREAHLIFENKASWLLHSVDFLRKEGEIMIGDVLKRTRTIYGYKATEMSSMLGISASYLSEIENNKKQPSLELLEKYAKIYGIRLSSLILLSENIEEAEKSGKGTAMIRNMMIHLIQGMSISAGDSDEYTP